MAPPVRDSRALPEWFQLDYFRRLRRWLRLAPRLTFLAALVLIAPTFLPSNAALYEAAPVSAPHALFNEDCQRCHRDAFQTPRRLLPGQSGLHTVADRACRDCHAAGPHHEEQQAFHTGCAGCHREHRGTRELTAVADRHCTSCHADLQRSDGTPTQLANVTDFVRDHPEFAVWRNPPSIQAEPFHFSHQVHLQTDGVADAGGAVVKLSCESCHQPDSQSRNFFPIRYEANCARCHPLAIQLIGRGMDPKTRKAADQFRQQPAPHRPPSEVRAALRERLMRLVEQEPSLLQPGQLSPSDRPLPREFEGMDRPEETSSEWVSRQLREAERTLFQGAGGCGYCHERKVIGNSGKLPEFAATGLPRPEVSRGRFRHDSHQILRCAECHPAAQSQRAGDILLPHIGTCQKCHNPKAGSRSDCVECHRYHDRSGERNWNGNWAIDEVLGSRHDVPRP